MPALPEYEILSGYSSRTLLNFTAIWIDRGIRFNVAYDGTISLTLFQAIH